jgi:hypothetical protein
LLLLILPATLGRLLPLFLYILHLQSELVLELLNNILLIVFLRTGIIFGEANATKYRFIEFGAFLPEYLETEDLRLVMIYLWWNHESLREMFQEGVREICAEEAPIQVDVTTSGGKMPIRHIGLLAPRTINFNSTSSWFVSHT